mmetsp:Transcript_87942/g.188649  ORF Transcript_87942/g.188649 Transcript_87942/m.188649 type:complete len:335 (-) Transcript_87942:149-1153(-)
MPCCNTHGALDAAHALEAFSRFRLGLPKVEALRDETLLHGVIKSVRHPQVHTEDAGGVQVDGLEMLLHVFPAIPTRSQVHHVNLYIHIEPLLGPSPFLLAPGLWCTAFTCVTKRRMPQRLVVPSPDGQSLISGLRTIFCPGVVLPTIPNVPMAAARLPAYPAPVPRRRIFPQVPTPLVDGEEALLLLGQGGAGPVLRLRLRWHRHLPTANACHLWHGKSLPVLGGYDAVPHPDSQAVLALGWYVEALVWVSRPEDLPHAYVWHGEVLARGLPTGLHLERLTSDLYARSRLKCPSNLASPALWQNEHLTGEQVCALPELDDGCKQHVARAPDIQA